MNKLTAKQAHFARCVASGMSQAAAYREAYDCDENSKAETQQQEASRLARNPHIAARIEALIRERERGVIASAVSDRERVLRRLRELLENAEGTPAEQVALRAADLLGKSIGLYRDVQVIEKPQRSAAELKQELEERLTALLGERVH
jgi:hypothetical protein